MDDLRQRRAHVWRADRDHVADELDPLHAALRRLMAGAARDEPAHRVADQHDLAHRDGPLRDELPQELGQVRPVRRDVAAGVEADVYGRRVDVALEP